MTGSNPTKVTRGRVACDEALRAVKATRQEREASRRVRARAADDEYVRRSHLRAGDPIQRALRSDLHPRPRPTVEEERLSAYAAGIHLKQCGLMSSLVRRTLLGTSHE